MLPLRIPLTESQIEHLQRLRDQQLADWRDGSPQFVDELFVAHDVVRLVSGMGRACYLGLDGRIWTTNLGEGQEPREVDDLRVAASCLVRWSNAIGLPELVGALPSAPNGDVGETCPLCHGTREMPAEIFARSEDGFKYYCQRCGGVGWLERQGG